MDAMIKSVGILRAYGRRICDIDVRNYGCYIKYREDKPTVGVPFGAISWVSSDWYDGKEPSNVE